jgi:hypothetical protein
MDIGKYKQAMRPKKYLDGKFIIYDETMPDASDAQLGARDEFAIGGQSVVREEFSEGTKIKLVNFVENFVKQNNRQPTIMEIANGAKASTASIKKYLKEGEDFTIASKLEAAKLGGKKPTGITKVNDKLVKEFKDLKIKGISTSVETTKAGSKSFRIRFDKKLGFKDIFVPATEENLNNLKSEVAQIIDSDNYSKNITPFQTDADKRKIRQFKEALYKKQDPYGVYKALQEYKTEKFPGTLSKEIQIQHGQPKFTTQTLSRFGLIPADVNVSAPVEKTERIRNNALKIAMSKLNNPNRSIADKEKIIEEFNDTMKGLRGQLKGTPAQGLVNFELLDIDQDGNITKLKDTGFNPKKGMAYGEALGELDLAKITKEQADEIINLGKQKIDAEAVKLQGLTTADKIKRPESAMTREMFDRFNKLRGVLIPGLEEIKDSLKKLPDDIKSKRYFTAALKGLGIVATPLIVSGMYNDFKSGKTVMETLERNLIGTDAIGGMKDIFALSPEEREARSVVKQAEMDEQIAQDFSGLDTDFQTPRVESKMSLEEALKEYEEGLKRVELEREQEEAGRAEGRASSFEGLKDLMLGERFQPQEIPQQFLASGGRVGFADGTPPDPSKRKFMKIMGALAAVPVIGKYFNLAKPLTKAAPAAVEAVKGIPPYFFKMVEKIKQYGDDVTKRFSTQEREQVYNYRTSDADYELIEDLNTGDTRIKVIKGDPDLPGYKEQELTLSKGKIDEATGNVPDAYDEYTVRSDFDGKMKDIDEGIDGIDDLIEDTIGFENVSIKELEDMGYDVNRLSPDFKKKLGIK